MKRPEMVDIFVYKSYQRRLVSSKHTYYL